MNRCWWAQPALLLAIAVVAISGCGGGGDAERIVYVCTETGRVTTGPAAAPPAVNPETGRRTLLPGVYCPECKKWYALPSPDHAGGNPKTPTCRIHHVPMTTDGPVN